MNQKNNQGFTLIELLVVISIIALLTSVVLSSLSNARQKAIDTKIISEYNQLIVALELHYSENGDYPTAAAGTYCIGSTNCLLADVAVNDELTSFTGYIPSTDYTIAGSRGFIYNIDGNGTRKILLTTNELQSVEAEVGIWTLSTSSN